MNAHEILLRTCEILRREIDLTRCDLQGLHCVLLVHDVKLNWNLCCVSRLHLDVCLTRCDCQRETDYCDPAIVRPKNHGALAVVCNDWRLIRWAVNWSNEYAAGH